MQSNQSLELSARNSILNASGIKITQARELNHYGQMDRNTQGTFSYIFENKTVT